MPARKVERANKPLSEFSGSDDSLGDDIEFAVAQFLANDDADVSSEEILDSIEGSNNPVGQSSFPDTPEKCKKPIDDADLDNDSHATDAATYATVLKTQSFPEELTDADLDNDSLAKDAAAYTTVLKTQPLPEELTDAVVQNVQGVLLSCVESLYRDRIWPTQGNVQRRLKEQKCSAPVISSAMPLFAREPAVYEVFPPSHLRNGQASVKLVNVPLWFDSFVDEEMVPQSKRDRPYGCEAWASLERFLKKDEDLVFDGGRYGAAIELRRQTIPGLEKLCLGELCHMVYLAEHQKHWLVTIENRLRTVAFVKKNVPEYDEAKRASRARRKKEKAELLQEKWASGANGYKNNGETVVLPLPNLVPFPDATSNPTLAMPPEYDLPDYSAMPWHNYAAYGVLPSMMWDPRLQEMPGYGMGPWWQGHEQLQGTNEYESV